MMGVEGTKYPDQQIRSLPPSAQPRRMMWKPNIPSRMVPPDLIFYREVGGDQIFGKGPNIPIDKNAHPPHPIDFPLPESNIASDPVLITGQSVLKSSPTTQDQIERHYPRASPRTDHEQHPVLDEDE